MIHLETPITEADILQLRAGDAVQISGIATTARDAAHKYMVERLIEAPKPLSGEEAKMYDLLYAILHEGVLYHCVRWCGRTASSGSLFQQDPPRVSGKKSTRTK